MPDGAVILADLEARGLLHDHTDRAQLADLLRAGPVTLYHGIDPTAPSMHLGNLIGVIVLRRFQDAGHRPVALVGGATGMVGDPGGRSEERNLLDRDTLAANVAGIRAQLERLLDFSGPTAAALVNNIDWTGEIHLLDFLRDVGKHVTVNQMVAKDSVRSRMEGDHGISYTEFSYMLLQANDYWWLHEHHDCSLQIGGSDQWGNITAGVDLIRRRSGATVHGLTWPLLTRADGAKFGKTAEGAVWLDPERTLPYEFHQYFLRADDRDVRRLLLQFTLLPVADIDAVMAEHEQAPEQRRAQRVLADAVTELVHGPEAVVRAALAADVLFGGAAVTVDGLEAIRGVVPEVAVSTELAGALVDLLVASGVATSKGDARRTLDERGFSINGEKVTVETNLTADDLVGGRYLLVQRGKKKRVLVEVTDRA